MGEVVETLIVKIETDLADLRRDLQKSGGIVKQGSETMSKSAAKAQRSFTSLGASVTRLAAKIGVAVGAFLSIRKVVNAFGESDALAKAADRLGLSTEALAGLQLAASQTGVSVGLLDTNLIAFNRRLGEAAEGTGPAAERLQMLGIAAQDLLALPLEERIGAVGDAINKLPEGPARAAAAFDLFGRSGVQMLNTLALGTEGIKDFQKEAIDLGFAINRVDAAKIEAANDAFDKLGKFIKGQARLLAVELAPALTFVVGEFVNAAKGGEALGSVGAAAGKAIVVGFTLGRSAAAGFRVIVDAGNLALAKMGEFATMGAQIGVRAFRVLAGGVFKLGQHITGIADVFVTAFQDIGIRATRLWELLKAGADVAAKSVMLVWQGVKTGVSGIFDALLRTLGDALRSVGDAIAPTAAALGLAEGVAANLSNTGHALVQGVENSAFAARQATGEARNQLDESVKGFSAAKDALFSGTDAGGSETLKNLSAAFGTLADEQAEAAVSGDHLTQRLQANIELLRTAADNARTALAASTENAAAVGGIDRINEAIAEFESLKAEREKQFAALLEQRQQHEANLTGVVRQGVDQRKQVLDGALNQLFSVNQEHLDNTRMQWESGLQGQAQLLSTFFGQVSQLQNSENRKQFEIGKAAAIAEASINTFLAATKAYQSLAGIPVVGPGLGAAAAAAAIAAGVQNVNRIRQMQFGGGAGAGGAAVPQSGGAAGGGGAEGGEGQSAPVQTQQFNISLQGERFSAEQVRTLIASINDQVGDNVTLATGGA